MSIGGNTEALKEGVRRIVNNYSGGIKFTELISILIHDFNFKLVSPDEVENLIRNEMIDVKILDYTWTSINRAKMFVYTP